MSGIETLETTSTASKYCSIKLSVTLWILSATENLEATCTIEYQRKVLLSSFSVNCCALGIHLPTQFKVEPLA